MKKNTNALRLFMGKFPQKPLYGLTAVLAALTFIALGSPAHAQQINNPTPYFNTNSSDAISSIPVVAGDVVQIWYTGYTTNCVATNIATAVFNIKQSTYNATTTIAVAGWHFNSGTAPTGCTANYSYSQIATTSETWNIEATSGGGSWNSFSVMATDYSETTISGGGTGSSTTNIYGQQIATSSQNALEVDNSIQDLFYGIIIMLACLYITIWIFKK